jgi:hypothetical protein
MHRRSTDPANGRRLKGRDSSELAACFARQFSCYRQKRIEERLLILSCFRTDSELVRGAERSERARVLLTPKVRLGDE